MMGTIVLHILFTAVNALIWFLAGRAWERRKKTESDKTEELLRHMRKRASEQTQNTNH